MSAAAFAASLKINITSRSCRGLECRDESRYVVPGFGFRDVRQQTMVEFGRQFTKVVACKNAFIEHLVNDHQCGTGSSITAS
ncbi:MAG: hypothetical protein U5O39_18190 [Gammaproteobacteria bacterium]|nr:hypothetical protein [Gammaproteobacteria bacterium]